MHDKKIWVGKNGEAIAAADKKKKLGLPCWRTG